MAKELISFRTASAKSNAFEAFDVSRSLDKLCGSFSFTFAFNTYEDIPYRRFDELEINVESNGIETLVMTGTIFGINPSVSSQSKTCTISGRSKTSILVDCSARPGTYKDVDPIKLIEDQCTIYEIDVITFCLPPVIERIPEIRVNIGQSVWRVIDDVCRQRGLVATDTPSGDVLITTAPVAATSQINLPGDASDCSLDINCEGQFGAYTVTGHHKGHSKTNKPWIQGAVSDPFIPEGGKWRDFEMQAEEGVRSDKDCKDRAAYKCAVASGQAFKYQCTKDGWKTPDGALWEPNTLVHIKDETLGVDKDLVLVSVSFKQSQQGPKASLSFETPAAYLPDTPTGYAASRGESPLAGIKLCEALNG